MRLLSIFELMHLTQIELIDLLVRITNALPDLPEGSVERQNALTTLSNIRRSSASYPGFEVRCVLSNIANFSPFNSLAARVALRR
jgi:hypothetical protein